MRYFLLSLLMICSCVHSADSVVMQTIYDHGVFGGEVYKFKDGYNTCYLTDVYGRQTISCVREQ